MHQIYLDNLIITKWECIRYLTCTPLNWWYGSLCVWDNSIQESRQHQKVRAWMNDSRKAPPENHLKMKTDNQLNVYLINEDDHANQWWFTNPNQNENRPQYGIRCVVGQKIKWYQIIHHQVCNPSHPCPQLNRVNRSRMCLLEWEAWWHPNAEKVWVWLNGSREIPLGDHNKIANRSLS